MSNKKRDFYRNFGSLSNNSVVTDLYNKRLDDLRKKHKKSKYKIKSYDEKVWQKSTKFFDNYFNK